MMMRNERLKNKLDQLPAQPGVYLFRDDHGKIIYVGKAKSLRSRVRSYFQDSVPPHPKLLSMRKRIADLEIIVVHSEVEALILENNLIKEYQPRYNINLKDDKSYPYIRITNEEFPRIFATRTIVRDGSVYLGPYTEAKNLRAILRSLRKIFPVRSCKLPLTSETIAQGKYKVCLDYHIKRCDGPCIGKVSSEEYRRMIQQVVRLLNGKTKELIEEFQREMQDAAGKLEFEKAARLRDQIQRIEQFYFTPPLVASEKLEDMDILSLARVPDDGVLVLFRIRDGKVVGKSHFYFSDIDGKDDQEVLDSFVSGKYLEQDNIPGEIIVPFESEFLAAYQQWFREQRQMKVRFHVPHRGDKKKLLDMVRKNAELLLQEVLLQKIQKESRIHHSVLALQKDLQLKNPPIRIEAFDISNIQGKYPVASMVGFENGKPKKSDYRHYHIREKNTPDDFRMMEEVVTRRYRRVLEENLPRPDLIVIDGGKGQLNTAVEVLKRLGLESVPIIGLAKREEEVFVPGQKEPLPLDKESVSVKLLRQIRDEAHRFALTFHRKTRTQSEMTSVLDEIPGIGRTRKKVLHTTFSSIEEILQADPASIAALPGFNATIAGKLLEFLRNHRNPSTVQ